jgi:hypothetical protein
MNPDDLKSLADFNFERSIHLKNIRESAHAKLNVPYNGGMFTATVDLIGFLNVWPDETVIIEDIYRNPIEVKRTELLSLIIPAYKNSMQWWLNEFDSGNRTSWRGHDV